MWAKSGLLLWITKMCLDSWQGCRLPTAFEQQHLMPLHMTIHQLWCFQMQLLQLLMKSMQVLFATILNIPILSQIIMCYSYPLLVNMKCLAFGYATILSPIMRWICNFTSPFSSMCICWKYCSDKGRIFHSQQIYLTSTIFCYPTQVESTNPVFHLSFLCISQAHCSNKKKLVTICSKSIWPPQCFYCNTNSRWVGKWMRENGGGDEVEWRFKWRQMKAHIFSKPGTWNGVFPMLTMMSPIMCSSQWYGIPIVSFMASSNWLPESFSKSESLQIFKFDGVSCKLCISSQVCSLGSNRVNNDFVKVFNNCFQFYSEWYSIIVNSSFVQGSIFLFLECIWTPNSFSKFCLLTIIEFFPESYPYSCKVWLHDWLYHMLLGFLGCFEWCSPILLSFPLLFLDVPNGHFFNLQSLNHPPNLFSKS